MRLTRSELLKTRLDRLARMVPGVEAGDVRALHRARVASRRLRELLPVLQLAPDVTRKHARRLRNVTERLGAVRELDVTLLLIGELHDARRARRAALSRTGAVVTKEQHDARKRLSSRLPAAEIRRVIRKLSHDVERLAAAEAKAGRGAQREWRWALDARIANRAARLRTTIADAGSVYLTERLHDVRIALKKLRYALELQAEAEGADRSAEARVLKRGQEILGRMHDVQVLIDRVRQVQASLTPPDVQAWRDLDALVVSLEDDCRRLHARYMRQRGALIVIANDFGGRESRARRAS
jgi:CHAD domain-containing protein